MMASTSKDTAAAAVAGTQENEDMTVENGENDKAPEPLSDVFQEEKDKATKLQTAMAALVRASNALPKFGDGYELYASYADYAKFMEQQKIRVILSMRKLLAHIGSRTKISKLDLDDMEKIIQANDLLIERLGISLDEHQRMITQEHLVKSQKVDTGAEAIPGSLTNANATSLLKEKAKAQPQKQKQNATTVECVSSSRSSLDGGVSTVQQTTVIKTQPNDRRRLSLDTTTMDTSIALTSFSSALDLTLTDADNTSIEDPVLELNRITKAKAKLEYRIDCCTAFGTDDELPSVESRLRALKRKNSAEGSGNISRMERNRRSEVEGSNSEDQKICTYIVDSGFNSQNDKDVNPKLKKVLDKLNNWSTPYECYLAHASTIASNEKRNPTKVKQEVEYND